MARMHARRKGKSSSTRPFRAGRPDWLEVDRQKVVSLIVEMYNKGYTTSRIGIELRDLHCIPDVKTALGVSMYDILKESGIKMEMPEDITNLMKRAVRLNKHLVGRKKDLHNWRALHLIEAKIRRLGRYYVQTGVLPQGWAYDIDSAKLLVGD